MPLAKTVPPGGPVEYSPDGQIKLNLEKIGPLAGGPTTAGATVDTAISITPTTGNIAKMLTLKGVCITAPGAATIATVEDGAGVGGATLLLVDLHATAVPGTTVEFNFPTPLTSQKEKAIVISTLANSGTWRWIVSGYFLDAGTLG